MASKFAGAFDDLAPAPVAAKGAFDDLVPASSEPQALGTLEGLGQRFKAGTLQTIGGTQQTLGETLSGILSTSLAPLDTIMAGAGGFPNPLGESADTFAATGEGVAGIGRDASQAAQAGIRPPSGIMDALANPGNTAKYYSGIVAESAPMMLGAMATRNPGAGAALMGVGTGGQTYSQERSEGAGKIASLIQGTVAGGMEAGLGQVPLETAFGPGSFTRRAALGSVQEAGTEGLTGGGQAAAAAALKGEDVSNEELTRAIVDSMVAGTIMGPTEAVLGSGTQPQADARAAARVAPAQAAPVSGAPADRSAEAIPADELLANAKAERDRLRAKRDGTPDTETVDEAGKKRAVKGAPAEFMSDRDKGVLAFLEANADNADAIASVLGVAVAKPADAAAQAEPAPLGDVPAESVDDIQAMLSAAGIAPAPTPSPVAPPIPVQAPTPGGAAAIQPQPAAPAAADPADSAPQAPAPVERDERRYSLTVDRDEKGAPKLDRAGRPLRKLAFRPEVDDLRTWIAARGGITPEVAAEAGLDPAAFRGKANVLVPLVPNGRLVHAGGMDQDTLRQRMQEDGWLNDAVDPNAPETVDDRDALDMLTNAINGKDAVLLQAGIERKQAEANEDRNEQDAYEQEQLVQIAGELGVSPETLRQDFDRQDERSTEWQQRADDIETALGAESPVMDDVSRMSAPELADMVRALQKDRHSDYVNGRQSGIQNVIALRERDAAGQLPPVVGFVDGDGFKAINDTYGHDAGDDVLRAIGAVLQRHVGDGLAFRRGGDEFIVRGEDGTALAQALEAAQAELAGMQFTFKDAAGNVGLTMQGAGISFGVGTNEKAAENAQYTDKAARADAGIRTERGADRRQAGREPGASRGAPDENRVQDREDRGPGPERESRGTGPAGLVPDATHADRLAAEQRAKDDQRDGKSGTGRTDVLSGDGELFAGSRPDQDSLLRRDDPVSSDYSRGKEAAPGISTDATETAIRQLRQDFASGLDRNGITIEVIPDQSAFGPDADGAVIKGAYYPASRRVVLVAANLRHAADARTTLRHELLAHAGLNLFDPETKRAILAKISATRDAKRFADLWATVEREYADQSDSIKAEELFALIAQNTPSRLQEWWDSFLTKTLLPALRKLGLARDDLTIAELRSLAASIAKGMREGKVQQTSPKSDAAQFKADQPTNDDAAPRFSRTTRDDATKRNEQSRAIAANGLPVSRGTPGWNHDSSMWEGRRGQLKRTRATLQDKMIGWRDVQDEIATQLGQAIPDAQNVYRLENLMHGRVSAGITAIERDHVEPLLDTMKAAKVSPETLEQYLYARHAKERNAHIKTLYKTDPQNDLFAGFSGELPPGFGSGMTDAEADAILADADTATLDPLARRVQALTKATRRKLLAAGLITQESHDAMEAQYEFYVPLRGKAQTETDFAGGNGSGSRGLDTRRAPVKTALGRGAGNQAENILGEIVGDAQRAVILAEKARVGRAVMRVVLANPNPKLWQVEPVQTERKLDANGEVYEAVVNDWSDPSIVAVKVKGQLYKVQINSQPLAQALNHIGIDQLSGLTRAAGALNRYFSAVLTKYNPAFVPANATRDAIFGLVGMAAEHGELAALDAALHYPQAARAAFRSAIGRSGDSTWDGYAKRFEAAGGKTGYVAMPSVEDLQRQIGRGSLSAIGSSGFARAAKGIGDAVGSLNDAVENALRLSAFVTLTKRGMSDEAAASYAKDLTVNFNRKGFDGSKWNAWFLFYNAALQGAKRTGDILRKPKTYAYLGALAAAQTVATLAALGMEDDDGEPLWNKVPDHVKRRNIVIPLKGGHILTIPMPYGFNLLTYMTGRTVAAVAQGGDRPENKVGALVADTLSAATESFFPVPLGDGAMGLLPTALRIPTNVQTNRDDFGRQIRMENPYGKFDVPRASMGRPDTLELFKLTSEGLNRLGGGSEYAPPPMAWLDVAPEDLEYLLKEATGGAGKFVIDVATLGEKLAGDGPVTAKDVPISTRFVSKVDEQAAQQSLYYDRSDALNRDLERVRDTFERDGAKAAQDMLRNTPTLSGAIFRRRKNPGKNGEPAGTIIVQDGRPQIVPGNPAGVFARYKAAEKIIRARSEAAREAYSATPASIIPTAATRQRDNEIREQNAAREEAQRRFNAAWVRDVLDDGE